MILSRELAPRRAIAGLVIALLYFVTRFCAHLLPVPLPPILQLAGVLAPFWACAAVLSFWMVGGFTRSSERPKIRRLNLRWLLSALALLVVLEIAHHGLFRGLPPGARLEKFDSRRWASTLSAEAGASQYSIRQKMLSDLVYHALPGKDRAHIEASLGAGSPAKAFASRGSPDLVFRLGPARDISLDSEWLLIWFDRESRFKGFRVEED